VIHKCRYCGKEDNIKVHITYGKPIKSKAKKDPNELMTSDQFIEGCWANKQRHIQIIPSQKIRSRHHGELSETKLSSNPCPCPIFTVSLHVVLFP